MRSNSHPHLRPDSLSQQAKQLNKKKLSLRSLAAEENAKESQPVQQKISDNGSLILDQFRLNSKGLRQTQKQVQTENVQGDLNLEDFEILGKLGNGKFGMVSKVRDKKTNQIYALKKMNYFCNDDQEKLLQKEIKALIDCKSEQITKCYSAYYSQGAVYILMEYMDAGTLANLLQKTGSMMESIVLIGFHQILKGLVYLHQNKIIHRDIKPQNILINMNGEVKVADLGICSMANNSDTLFNTFVGTVPYMSPERLNGEQYGFNSDIWSFGIMLLEALTGSLPIDRLEYYCNQGLIPFLTEIKKFNYDEYINEKKLSSTTKELIKCSLKQNPQERLSSQQLLQTKAMKFAGNLNLDLFKEWIKVTMEDL